MSGPFTLPVGFQDPATPIMEGLIDLHNYIFFYLTLIFILVLYMFYRIILDFYFTIRYPRNQAICWTNRKDLRKGMKISHGSDLEMFWTITPSFILLLIAVPSFALLYAMDEVLSPLLTFKAIGHQWYWSYEYSDFDTTIGFDSNLVFEDELKKGEFRLLQVDNPVILPIDTHIRVIITSLDVLHSWAVPSLGVKVDAAPGRLNQAFIYLKREGVFYGQCSELCGVNHGFMPIVVKGVSVDEFLAWVSKELQLN